MTPKELIERLAHLAAEARHHPEPAVSVAMLADLVLELAQQLEPLVSKFNLLLSAAGFPDDSLADLVNQAEAELATTTPPDLADLDQLTPGPDAPSTPAA